MRETFVDEVTIEARSGRGGNGCVAFRREKYVPLGGPNGGDGGRGGDVVAVAELGRRTLLDFRYYRRQFAKDGVPGGGSQCTGADGAPCLLRVPVGTQLFDAEDGTLLADLDTPGAEVVLLQGGRGGKGNEFFKNSVRQTPDFAQPGELGIAKSLRLELKLLADVGIIGMPNVGKSSLIARISASRPKIADYPFTTLVPNLGVVAFGDGQHFVVADVPGLIVGAHTGAGLGAQFLRHVERVRLLVHIVTAETDLPDRAPEADFIAISEEMRLHNPKLAELRQVLVLNQTDRPEVAEHTEALKQYAEANNIPFFSISAASGAGIPDLVSYLGHALSVELAPTPAQQVAPVSSSWDDDAPLPAATPAGV